MIPRPIYYKNKTDFLTSNSNYLESTCQYYNDIVYIEDTEEIYTHGKIFGDKGIELNLFDLASGNTTIIQENYQKIKAKYDEDPDNPVVAHIYYEQDGKTHRLDKQILLFQRIALTDSFTALWFNVDNSSDNVEVSYYSINSEGEFTTGSRTIVTADKIATGTEDGSIAVNGQNIPVKGLGSAAFTDTSDYIQATDLTKTKFIQGVNEIWYKLDDSSTFNPRLPDNYGINLVSNTYDPERNICIMEFDGKVDHIPPEMFCEAPLIEIWIPSECTEMYNGVFYNCSDIKDVYFVPGASLTIRTGAFDGSAVKRLTINREYVDIQDDAFYNSVIETITFTSLSTPRLSDYAFGNATGIKIYVPPQAYDDYCETFANKPCRVYTYSIVYKWDAFSISRLDGFEGTISGLFYALPHESNGDEDDVLLSRSTVKTINGNSIVGSGDLTITAGNVGTEDDNDGVDDVNTQTYLRYVEQSLTDDQKTQARTNIGAASISDLDSKQDSSTLATVATSGSYNDLSNKPTIPSAVTESTVSGWGFTKNTGTITGVTINNTTKNPTNGVVDLGTTAPAYAEYTGTSTAVVVTTKYGYFPTTLVEGARVSVKFEGALTSISTLNVNGTGVKNVYYKGNSLTSGMINQYNTYEFIYDGSYYRIIGINTDTNTHYNAKNIVGASTTATANATATGSVYLNLIENSTVRSTHSITGSNNISVSSNASGNITISGPELKTINGTSIIGSGNINAGNITVASGAADTTTLQHNTMLMWTEAGGTSSMLLEFPTGTGSALNCGFFLEMTIDAAADFSLSFDGEIHWANDTAPELEQECAYEMWFTSYDNGSSWLGVFTKYTM